MTNRIITGGRRIVRTAWTNPGTITETAYNGEASDYSWDNRNNAKVEDAVTTTWSGYYSSSVAHSNLLRATNFSFSIPATAEILGYEMKVKRRFITGNTFDDECVSLLSGLTLVGDNKASATPWPITTLTFESYGSKTDLWGTSLSPADVNDSDFGVGLAIHANSFQVAGEAQVDVFLMRVSYLW